VSFWEAELGGVCASRQGTNRRRTLSDYGALQTASLRTHADLYLQQRPALKGARASGSGGTVGGEGGVDLLGNSQDLFHAPSFNEVDKASDGEDEKEGRDTLGGHGSGLEALDDPAEWYCFGIIDILQRYDMQKYLEGTYKSRVRGKQGVSAVSSSLYAQRFVAFLEEHTN
jgi:hypothetical protein